MPILPFGDTKPDIDPEAYISTQATIVGDVTISEGVSVWPGAVIRGDRASVSIEQNSCVQDSVVIHAHNEENPAMIGSHTAIGSSSVLHGVYLGDSVDIGEACVVFDGATLGEGVKLAPGSIVPENVVIPPRSLNSGSPASQIRELSQKDVERQKTNAKVISQVFQKLRKWQFQP